MIKKYFTPFIFCLLFSCVSNFDLPTHKDRLHLKEFMIKKSNGDSLRIDWFFYSLISNTTLDYIESNYNGKIDTLCWSSEIANTYLLKDTLVFEFYSKPNCYENILSKKESFGFPIKIDTTIQRPSNQKVREDYMY